MTYMNKQDLQEDWLFVILICHIYQTLLEIRSNKPVFICVIFCGYHYYGNTSAFVHRGLQNPQNMKVPCCI